MNFCVNTIMSVCRYIRRLQEGMTSKYGFTPYHDDIHGNKLTNLLLFPAHERYDKLLETAIKVFRLLSFLSCQSGFASIVTGFRKFRDCLCLVRMAHDV